jgi:ATP-dependent Lon protease
MAKTKTPAKRTTKPVKESKIENELVVESGEELDLPTEEERILISPEKNEVLDAPTHVPVLALRDVVIFPYMIFPVLVGRESSLSATSSAVSRDKFIFLVAQKNSAVDDPKKEDLYRDGTLAKIVRIIRLPNGLMKVLVDGLEQASAVEYVQGEGHIEAMIELAKPSKEMTQELEALTRHTSDLFREYVRQSRQIPQEVLLAFENITDARRKLFYIAAHITKDLQSKQRILEISDIREQYLHVTSLLASEIDIMKIEQEIDQKVQNTIQKSQRKYFLSEQIKILQQELGEDVDEQHPELGKLAEQLDAAGLPEAVQIRVNEELTRFKKTPAMSPEAGVIRTYLETIAALPWKKRSADHLNIENVKRVLDADHYGLEKPKERILEHIAVLNLVDKMHGQILCLVGPPGVGKTSLARSIANAVGREFVRISLGGVRDEAEIRGHRRTYIGALPGKIIQSMKKAGVVNPLMLLDEVDKMSMDFRGDPSSALLEVLDPEQNSTFSDHYLEVEYDLSNVFFVTTANVRYNIPLPLLDRMEVIEIPGYLEHDKLEIAKRHIVPAQLKAHGLSAQNVVFSDEAILGIIRKYTEEAGVRNLVRQIARICRKVARQIVTEAYQQEDAKQAKLAKKGKKPTKVAPRVEATKVEHSNIEVTENGELTTKIEEPIVVEHIKVDPNFKVTVTAEKLEGYLGVSQLRNKKSEIVPKVGAVMGLAWTSTGGDVLPVEALVMDGTEKLTLTGQLGDVMKESAQAALSYIRSHAKDLAIDPAFTKNKEVHIHLPEGAIPKDGPSAGVTLIMAMISAITGRPARGDIAMTGEITLRGNVLPIGGLQEKLLAAKREGIHCVLIPYENLRTLTEIQDTVKAGLNIVPIKTVDQAVPLVFDLTTDAAKLGKKLQPVKEAVKAKAGKKTSKKK